MQVAHKLTVRVNKKEERKRSHEQFVALCEQTLLCVPHLLQVSPSIVQCLQPLHVSPNVTAMHNGQSSETKRQIIHVVATTDKSEILRE